MTDWIDFACYAVFLGALYFVVGGALSRLGFLAVLERNPEWLEAHPDTRERLARAGGARLLSYALGTISLALLTACQFRLWPAALAAPRFEPAHWMVLKDLATALTLPLLVAYGVGTLLFYRWLSTVPQRERRAATLTPRELGDFVPTSVRVPTYFAIAAHLGAWIGAGAWLIASTPERWLAQASQFFGAALAFAVTHTVFFWIARAAVRRRPGTLDRLFGVTFRQRQVQTIFACNWLVMVTGTLRLLGELRTEGHLARISQLVLVVGVLALCVIASWPRRPAAGTGASVAA